MKYYFILYLSEFNVLYIFYYILILYRGLPAGISHKSPENPSAQVHIAVCVCVQSVILFKFLHKSIFAPSVQVPPFLHGLGLQTK